MISISPWLQAAFFVFKESLSTTMHCALMFVYTSKFNMIINSRGMLNRCAVCSAITKIILKASANKVKCQTPSPTQI